MGSAARSEPASGPRGLARRAPLATFLGLTFLFTWSLLPLARTSVPVSLVALFGPAVAAVIVAALGGREQWRELRARVTDWRISVRWYLLALSLPLLVSALRSILEYALGARGPIQLQPISVLNMLVFVLVVGEEIGWRGFALPRLLDRRGPWSASAIVGVAWALWHLPLFHLPGMPQFESPFLPFVGYTVALSVLLTFLAQRTRGSVVIATVFHGAVNTFGLVNIAAGPDMRGWGNAASYGVAAILVGLLAWRRRGGSA